MRIAMVSQTDTPWTGPYARYFLSRGHDVRVFSYHADPLEGVDVVPLSGSRPEWIRREIWFIRVLPRLKKMLREFAPDVVFSAYLSSNSVTAALVWNGPHVISARGGDVNKDEFGKYPTWPWLHRRLIRYVCNRASEIHAVSDQLAEGITECGIPADRIHSFPLGVDVGRFRFVDRSARGKRVKQIVCTRRQELIYDNDVVVDALANLRDRGCSFRAVMVGGGPLLDERKEQARKLGLDQVEFTGQIDPDRLGKILEESEIYISAAVSDGTSSSLLEAMASGLFPVLARIRGNLDWIRDGETGLFFKVSDAGDLGRALERSLADDLLRARAAPENRSLAERRGDRRVNMERMMELVERAASSGGPGPGSG